MKHVIGPADDFPRASFRLPNDWIEDHTDPEVSQFFLPSGPDSGPSPMGGVLFVFSGRKKISLENAPQAFDDYVLTKLAKKHPRKLQDSTWLTYEKQLEKQSTHTNVIHKWMRLKLVADAVHLVGWNFVGLADFYDGPFPGASESFQVLEEEIQAAKIDWS